MPSVIRTPKQLGTAVRRRRTARELTQTEVAAQARTRQATISSLESGSAGARLGTLFDVLAALDLELVVRPRGKASPEDIAKVF